MLFNKDYGRQNKMQMQYTMYFKKTCNFSDKSVPTLQTVKNTVEVCNALSIIQHNYDLEMISEIIDNNDKNKLILRFF